MVNNTKARNNTNINMQVEEEEEEEEEKVKMFKYGSEVEVTSNEEGFRGAWYRATVLESPYHSQPHTSSSASGSKKKGRNGKCALVQYHNLLTDDGKNPLTEVVEVASIRPVPPSDDNNNNNKITDFEENDVVDAFYNDGWWTGVVCRVFEDRNSGNANKKFWVYYDSPRDVFEFEAKDMRPHRDWINGNWVLAPKHIHKKPTGSPFSSGCPVEIQIDHEDLRDVWVPATVLSDLNGKFLVKHKGSSIGDEAGLLETTVDKLHIRPVPYMELECTGYKNKPEASQRGRKTIKKRKGRPRKSAVKMPNSEGTKGTLMDEAAVCDDNVPFLKSSPLWNTLESMEVFKSLPQKPHFSPLSKCREEYREGTAIGMMVTYSRIVETVQTLKFDDPTRIFSSILEGLLDLESHGFDVVALRGRINDLLRLKDQHFQLQDEIEDAEAKISQLTHEVKEFDTEVCEIGKEISSLQQRLLHAKSKKENALSEMSRLHLHLEAVNENISNASQEFEKLARSLFELPHSK